jgi:UDP-glucuronate decarboxylase
MMVIWFSVYHKDDPTNRKPDIRKANEILSWHPDVKFVDGLLLTIAYFNSLIP